MQRLSQTALKIFTKTQKARDAQQAVMEFLLINHPLDCPICDQGGECELQDIATGYGAGVSRFTEGKRVVVDEDLGPLVATDMTRCIQCTRCVRFGSEIAGVRELGATGRGEHMRIGTYIKHTMSYEMSGNIIDVCPVGALTSKPYRFTARAWELQQSAGVAQHDCLGSNLHIHSRRNAVMRVVPRENESINETWLSDRDRFSYEGVNHEDRLTKPMIKQDGVWHEVEWQVALQAVVHGLGGIIDKVGADQVGCMASANCTTEEFYLLQSLMTQLGVHNVDHRLRETDVCDQATQAVFPGLGMPVADIAKHDVIVLVGSYPKQDQPIANHHIRQAVLQGAKLISINPYDHEFNCDVAEKVVVSPAMMLETLAGIARALKADLDTVTPNEQQARIAGLLASAENPLLILGNLAEQHSQAASLRSLSELIAQKANGHCARLTFGANAAGAWLAGMVPHRDAAAGAQTTVGLSAQAQLDAQLKAYFLMNLEPDHDLANVHGAMKALDNAVFVCALASYKNTSLEAVADVILPIAAMTETAGTVVNAAGDWQSFTPAVHPKGESRPAWKVLRVSG